MSRVITFSRYFPAYHPRKGDPTYFVEKIFNGLVRLRLPIQSTGLDYDAELSNEEKYHTIRAGRRWKVGDKFSPRVWSGKPYCSPMLTIAPNIEIKKIWDIEIDGNLFIVSGKEFYHQHVSRWHDNIEKLAINDGLSVGELFNWFKIPTQFEGQIICWNDKIEY